LRSIPQHPHERETGNARGGQEQSRLAARESAQVLADALNSPLLEPGRELAGLLCDLTRHVGDGTRLAATGHFMELRTYVAKRRGGALRLHITLTLEFATHIVNDIQRFGLRFFLHRARMLACRCTEVVNAVDRFVLHNLGW
jgi:hypothetical protein